MSEFLQLHLLTAYGPSNLNRDDTGRPKSVVFGGVPRLRISSQSLKRAWRTSDVFAERLDGHLGKRTLRLGEEIKAHLTKQGVQEKEATKVARDIASVFGKIVKEEKTDKGKNPTHIEQLAFVSPEERDAALSLADEAIAGKDIKSEKESLLRAVDTAADIAMFGRMLASTPEFNREAAVQVSHALTTHRSVAEDDYYTAMDDLKSEQVQEDAGAGFIGVQEFGSGVFYLYISVNRELLLKNLDETKVVRDASLKALVEAATTIGPKGKQASFASSSRALYLLAEIGSVQPRSLAVAFLDPIKDANFGKSSVVRLKEFKDKIDKAYGPCAEDRCEMDVLSGKGKLDEVLNFAVK